MPTPPSRSPSSSAPTATLKGGVPAQERPGLGPGTCIGRYVIVDWVGEGGMGVVYKAYDPQLGRTVALKLVRTKADTKHGAGGTPRDRFLREARALALVAHPNVISVHDAGAFGDDVFIAMEFVEGPTLKDWLASAHRSQREILGAFLAAGAGLVAAHAAGLVHRDFKPENVILSLDGRVRVLDFGLARTADSADDDPDETAPEGGEERTAKQPPREPPAPAPASRSDSSSRSGRGRVTQLSSLTEAHAIMGTPRFMAPEQHMGHAVDERADQFSFCVALYVALYGAHPFGDDRLTDLAENVILGKVSDAPANARVPRWLRQALLRGLAVEPDGRFPSMQALLDALRADPSAARWRWVWSGAAVVLLATVGLGWLGSHRSREQACLGGERKLVGVWDDDRRAAVRAAFLATRLPYAESVLRTVDRTLDDYAGSWVRMHVDACEATLVRHEQSQDLLDLRMACLSDRLTQMKTLSDVFASGDAKVVERAVESAQSLGTLTPCADTAALRAPIPPPSDPEAARRVAELRERIAQTNALYAAGEYARGSHLAAESLAAAETIHYAPIEAEAAYSLGKLLGDNGDYGGASRALYHALVAATAGRHDTIAARATIALIHADGAMRSQFEEADRWAELAEASVSRLQRKDELLGELYEERSVIRRRESKPEEALRDAKQALDLRLRVFGPDHSRVSTTYLFLGNAYWALARYPEALDSFAHATAIIVTQEGPDHPTLAPVLVGTGNVLGDMGDHDGALADYRRALGILQRVQPDDPDIGGIYNNIGDELETMGKPREALAEFLRALASREKTLGPSFELALVLDNLGEVSLDLDDPVAAMRYFRRALSIADEVLGPAHALRAGALWGIGEAYRREGKLDEAWSYFERALPLAEKAMGPEHPMLAKPLLLGIGLVQLARHEPAAAVATLERALTLEQSGSKPIDLADVRFALARALAATGERARAASLASQAKSTYAADGAQSKRELDELNRWVARSAP